MFVEIQNGRVYKYNSIIAKEECIIDNKNTFWVESDIPPYPEDGRQYYLSLNDSKKFEWIEDSSSIKEPILTETEEAILNTNMNVEFLVAMQEMTI